MRQAILFYTFLIIFVLTAAITLLGVAGVIDVPDARLNLLVGALLVELAAAVIALYRKTDFFARPSDNLAATLGSTIEAFDRLSDEIESTIKDRPADPSHPHRFLIRRQGDSVIAYERMRVVTADELNSLPEDQRDLIRTYEDSMNALTRGWKATKRKSGTDQLDPAVREQQLMLLRAAKTDLVGLLDFLQARGIYLDDHYDEVRHLVANL